MNFSVGLCSQIGLGGMMGKHRLGSMGILVDEISEDGVDEISVVDEISDPRMDRVLISSDKNSGLGTGNIGRIHGRKEIRFSTDPV
jgi:hypothetical protein